VCGICGRAVVAPTPEEYDRAIDLVPPGRGLDVTVRGHRLIEGALASVRCRDHAPRAEWD
jgi:hypothetical protein